MSKPHPLTYHHTQKAPWFLLLFAFAVLFFTLTWSLRDEPALRACGAVGSGTSGDGIVSSSGTSGV